MADKMRRGNWMVTVPLAAGAVLYLLLVFLPGRRAIGELQSQLELKENTVARAVEVTTSLQIARRDYDQASLYEQQWRKRLPGEQMLAAAYGKIVAQAKAAGVVLTRFDPQDAAALQTIRRIPLQLGCEGSYAQIHGFLQGLETLPTIIWLDNVKLERSTSVGKSVKGELVISVFADNPEFSDYTNGAGKPINEGAVTERSER